METYGIGELEEGCVYAEADASGSPGNIWYTVKNGVLFDDGAYGALGIRTMSESGMPYNRAAMARFVKLSRNEMHALGSLSIYSVPVRVAFAADIPAEIAAYSMAEAENTASDPDRWDAELLAEITGMFVRAADAGLVSLCGAERTDEGVTEVGPADGSAENGEADGEEEDGLPV